MVFRPFAGVPAPDSIGPTELQDNAVTNPKMADNAVTGSELAVGAIDNANKFASGVVDTTAIGNGAVTIAKAVAALARKKMYVSEVDIDETGTDRKQFDLVKFNKKDVRKAKDIIALVPSRVLAAANSAFLELWIDSPNGDWNGSDVYTGVDTPDASLEITNEVEALNEVAVGESTVQALSDAKHTVRFAVRGNNVSSQVFSDLREVFIDPED